MTVGDANGGHQPGAQADGANAPGHDPGHAPGDDPGHAPRHRPGAGRIIPTATYRLQVHSGFTFDQAAEQARYLADLGVSHAYLSPILQPAPGSTHGYDVVDHTRYNQEAGGSEFVRLSRTLALFGLGIIVDVVPNHMATPTPAWLNAPWWSLLSGGQGSPHAHWFDVDWEAEDGRVLVPVLGAPLAEVLASGELTVSRDGGPHGDEWVVRYHDHAFPVAEGTEELDLPELLAAQHYRLADWREGGTRLNYRRFFDVTSLAAIRVEDPDVFDATHRLLLDAFAAGHVDGFRIDHPDGLADPAGYLERLADATGDAWVVAEKILEGEEELPGYWRCAGTTGYDALLRVAQLFHDPGAGERLSALSTELLGRPQDLGAMVTAAKQQVVAEVQAAEVNRLMRLVESALPWDDVESLRRALGALLVAMDRYRAYLGDGVPADLGQAHVVTAAEERALELLAERDHLNLRVIAQLARGGRLQEAYADSDEARHEFVQRFQQTTGPVMAKGIEDTAFYRYVRLTGLNEVGGDPGEVGAPPRAFHDYATHRLATWPLTMTTLSTHDTKRSEDVRARLAVLSEDPDGWASWVRTARELAADHRGARLDAATEYLLWQTLVGAWPVSTERLAEYATKAVREAKLHTTWTAQDPAYEQAVGRFVDGVTRDPTVVRHVESWVAATAESFRANVLGQKLVQLAMPGVPDVYQGSELVDLSLVDPDNRRPIDYARRADLLSRLDRGERPDDLDAEKLLVTSTALRLRRERPGWFTGPDSTYAAVPASSPHAVAFARGDHDGAGAVAVATRLAGRLAASGGWGEATLSLPAGEWQDAVTGRVVVAAGEAAGADGAGRVRLSRVLADLPVALLVRHGSLGRDDHS
ncbi:malto-oligosyltrehalose synthase [Phycicoccus ginsengisoli]